MADTLFYGWSMELREDPPRTVAIDDQGFVKVSLPGHHTVEVMRAVVQVREGAFLSGVRVGRRAMANDMRKLLREGEE